MIRLEINIKCIHQMYTHRVVGPWLNHNEVFINATHSSCSYNSTKKVVFQGFICNMFTTTNIEALSSNEDRFLRIWVVLRAFFLPTDFSELPLFLNNFQPGGLSITHWRKFKKLKSSLRLSFQDNYTATILRQVSLSIIAKHGKRRNVQLKLWLGMKDGSH